MLMFLFFTTYYVCYMRIFSFKPSKMRSSKNIPIIHTWLWGLGNKTKEIILSLSNEQCITYVYSPKPWNQVRLLSYRNWPHLHELVDNHFHQTLGNYIRFQYVPRVQMHVWGRLNERDVGRKNSGDVRGRGILFPSSSPVKKKNGEALYAYG